MRSYNPLQAPDPAAWLALQEPERIALVSACQKQAGVKTRLPDMHTIMHVTIENQIASPESPQAKQAMERLQAEGLDRHDALHAIGSVQTGFMNDMLANKSSRGFGTPAYHAALDRLTADSWRKEFA
jgi:hypothetical protein